MIQMSATPTSRDGAYADLRTLGFGPTEAGVMLTEATHDGESQPRDGWQVFYLGDGYYQISQQPEPGDELAEAAWRGLTPTGRQAAILGNLREQAAARTAPDWPWPAEPVTPFIRALEAPDDDPGDDPGDSPFRPWQPQPDMPPR
jgi:hypothetical protein